MWNLKRGLGDFLVAPLDDDAVLSLHGGDVLARVRHVAVVVEHLVTLQ